jgi:hypothetical protein
MARVIGAMVVTFMLFAVPPHAAATCAWVLWEQIVIVGGSPRPVTEEWKYHDAETDRTICERRRDDAVKHFHRSEEIAQSRHKAHRDGLTRFTDDQIITTSYKCVPDTIDPRGAKGGDGR